MHAADIFFFGTLAFLLGVLFSSVGLTYEILIILAVLEVLCITALLTHHRLPVPLGAVSRRGFVILAALSLLLPVGALYYGFDDARFRATNIPFDETIEFSGVVVNDVHARNGVQDAVLELAPPLTGRILVKFPAYPEYRYGDVLRVSGTIRQPVPDGYAEYLAKERVRGTVSFARAELVGDGAGSPIRAFLFSIKRSLTDSFSRLLPAKEAALLSGLTVGERSDFSDEFRAAMQQSGTTHLVALSGYNVTIVLWVAMAMFLGVFNRRTAIGCAALVLVGFVMMTGAEASVVRAAIMGSLALFARELGRPHGIRNAIALAALAMVLVNPKVLAFDVGFQLSFLALIGIVALAPSFGKLLGSRRDDFLLWRENLATTTAAQLSVAPLLISQFGSVSATALIGNVLILGTVPLTMGLGFVTALIALFAVAAAQPLAWLSWVLLRYQVLVIELFAEVSVPIAPATSARWVVVYYGALVLVAVYGKRIINRTAAA